MKKKTNETLFITIFQLENYLTNKVSKNIFILYSLPNDDELMPKKIVIFPQKAFFLNSF